MCEAHGKKAVIGNKKMEELLASENESGEATDDTENETGNDVDNSQEVGNE